ncbi:MAG: hypothetical protein ABH862_05840 [Candidatus Omnitrophota bacterium]
MYRIIRKKIVVILVLAVYCSTAFSEQSASADTKFIERIVQKQASLIEMRQNSADIMTVFKKYMKTEDVSEDVLKAIEKTNSLSDSKYVDRLENKLTSIIKDSIKDADSMRVFMPSPAMVGTVTPESENKLEYIEEGKAEKKE